MITPYNPCVLILQTDVLLKRAFISLMNLDKGLDIVISEAVDIPGFSMDVSKINPTAVLFSESQPMAAKESVAQLLMSNTRLRIIVVSVESNWLHIFDKEDLLLTSLDDLLAVIKFDNNHMFSMTTPKKEI